MAVFGTAHIVFEKFDEMAEQIGDLVDLALEKASRDIEALAKANAPVDTGNMKNAVYSASPNHTTYAETGEGNQPQEIPGDHEAIVHSGAPYSVYVDYGTAHVPARPFFSGAVEAVRPGLEAAMAQIIGGGLK